MRSPDAYRSSCRRTSPDRSRSRPHHRDCHRAVDSPGMDVKPPPLAASCRSGSVTRATILVVESRGSRTVNVIEWEDALGNSPRISRPRGCKG